MKKIELSSQTFEPILKKIEELDKVQRLAICIVTIGILGAAFYFLSAAPTMKAIDTYQKEYSATEKKLDVAKKKAAQLVKLQNERKMKEFEFRKVMRALPETKELPALVTSISQAGQDTGIELISVTPMVEGNKGFYGEIPININFKGSYHNTVVFFDKLTSLNRIVNIRNIDMKADPKDSNAEATGVVKLETKCQAVTYKFVEQKQENDGKGKKDKKRKKK